ncbi:MAG: hypothetical protein R2799_03355 [Crocinitomicaceae bacterium]
MITDIDQAAEDSQILRKIGVNETQDPRFQTLDSRQAVEDSQIMRKTVVNEILDSRL